jgi:fatty acid desaturase
MAILVEAAKPAETRHQTGAKVSSAASDSTDSTKYSDGAATGSDANGRAVWSSGVPFYPPSQKLWRIGGKWYDFEPFLKHHPGGAEVVLMARDRFEDSTFAFESHHHNYARARKIIARYEVKEPQEPCWKPEQVKEPVGVDAAAPHHRGECPRLVDDEAFFSVLRKRLTEYLIKVGCPSGGPTRECCIAFWLILAISVASFALMYWSGHALAALNFGFWAALLGAFGHNWVHQPEYKIWAFLSLDTIGFSSTGWFREHVLQHHMYTNTPWDNHFKGTDPFLVTDPTVPRNWVQANVLPYLNPLVLTFGLPANFIAHFTEMLNCNEKWRAGKLIYPMYWAVMLHRWGLGRGVLLMYLWQALLGIWYFSMALMNHNAERCMDVKARNNARDWAEAQLVCSADWSVLSPFWSCWIFLWLNYHTVHHVFPRLDFSHHAEAQKILLETCAEHNVRYVAGDFWTIYREMVTSFSHARSLCEEIIVYGQ